MIQEHGCNKPDQCELCGCPRLEIERQWKTRGFIQAVWKCTHCHARNRTQTPNEFIVAKLAEEAKNGSKRSRRGAKKKHNWWGDD